MLVEDLSLWRQALGGMRGNLLVLQLRAAERERRVRRRWYAQPWLWGAVAGLVAALVYSKIAWNFCDFSLPELLGAWLVKAALGAFIVWNAEGLVYAAYHALQFLAPPERRASHLGLGDGHPPAAYDAREVVCGLLWVLLPPLLWRAALGAVLAWASVLLLYATYPYTGLDFLLELGMLPEALAALGLLAWPMTLPVLFASSALALAALLLSLVAIGRGLSPGRSRFTAAVVLVLQWLYFGFNSFLAAQSFYRPDYIEYCKCIDNRPPQPLPADTPVLADFALALLTGAVVLWLARGIYRVCLDSPRARSVSAGVLPLIPLLVCLLWMATTYVQLLGVPEGLLAATAWHLYANSSALTVCNFLALPSALCFGLAEDTPRMIISTPLWLSMLVLLGVQAGLVWLSANYASAAVEYRLEDGE